MEKPNCSDGVCSLDKGPDLLTEQINLLMDRMLIVESHDLRRIMLQSFVKHNGEIPSEYQDAVNTVLEM